jgi:hypothetical protein
VGWLAQMGAGDQAWCGPGPGCECGAALLGTPAAGEHHFVDPGRSELGHVGLGLTSSRVEVMDLAGVQARLARLHYRRISRLRSSSYSTGSWPNSRGG